jgi:hypothetical protein
MASFTASFAPALPARLCGAGSRSLKPSSRAAVRVSAKGDGSRVDRFSKDGVMYVTVHFLDVLIRLCNRRALRRHRYRTRGWVWKDRASFYSCAVQEF